MNGLHFYASLFLLLFLAACSQPENALDPVPASDAQAPAYEWKAPATLTGDLDANLRTIAQLAEVSLEELTADKTSSIVFLAANSNDELAAKIQEAGTGGTVVVLPGAHYESATVTVNHRVKIIGFPGAVIHSGVQNLLSAPTVQAALHLKNANHSVVAGLSFVPASGGQDGGTVILIEDSKQVITTLNTMTGFQFGILLQEADNNQILGNHITVSDIALSQFIDAHGIVVINGDNAKVRWNQISNGLFGMWACDKNGLYQFNYTHGNYIGLILCNVPQAIPLPSGQVVGSVQPATNWKAINNISINNFSIGYLVIDGASKNTLTNNQGGGNVDYDVELTTDTYRFGFLTPAAFDNTVNAGPHNLIIKDCGPNNTVNGGTQVDISADPCM